MPSSFSEAIQSYQRVVEEYREVVRESDEDHARRVEDFNNTWDPEPLVYTQPPIAHRVWEAEPDRTWGDPRSITISRRAYRAPLVPMPVSYEEGSYKTTKSVPDIAILFAKEKNLCQTLPR